MNQQKPVDVRETISALVDGEASDWELRKVLQQSTDNVSDGTGDHSLREDWASYQTISAVLRKEPVAGIDISSAVMDAIEDESSSSGLGYFHKFNNLGRTFGQTAIAASVAVVALIGIQQYQVAQNDLAGSTSVAETSSQTEVRPVVQPPAGFELQPVTRAVSSSTEPSLKQGARVQIPVDRDQLKAHLDELVQEHSEHSVNLTQEVMPMVRVPASTEAK